MATTVQPKLKRKTIPGVRPKPVLSRGLRPRTVKSSTNQPKISRD
jgi:hypothetical protein